MFTSFHTKYMERYKKFLTMQWLCKQKSDENSLTSWEETFDYYVLFKLTGTRTLLIWLTTLEMSLTEHKTKEVTTTSTLLSSTISISSPESHKTINLLLNSQL